MAADPVWVCMIGILRDEVGAQIPLLKAVHIPILRDCGDKTQARIKCGEGRVTVAVVGKE